MHTNFRGAGRGRLKGFAALIAVAALLAVPAGALAQSVDPTDAQYSGTLEQISQGGGNQSSGDPAGSADPQRVTGGLPFTGLDLAALALVAVALGGAGLLLRSRTRASGDLTR